MSKDKADTALMQMSRPALAAEVLQLRGQINELRGEVLKQQIVAATRLDAIRLLGFMMNRDPAPDPLIIAPKTPEVRSMMAAELKDLAEHLRTRATEFEATVAKLLQANEEGEPQASS